jgi:nucleoside-diphosphate-sugar epimerase
MQDLAVVIGGTGGFGFGVAQELRQGGHRVRALVRREGPAVARLAANGIEIQLGDAQDRSHLAVAVADAAIVVHAINYPYQQWEPALREVSAKIIAATREVGARLVFPGNVYGFGAETSRAIPEGTAQEATTRKGRLRAELEFMIERATDDGRMRALIVRAGDYFGPSVRNGLVDRIFGHAIAGRAIAVLGDPRAAHQWSYLPDVARLATQLLALGDALQPFEVVHHAGHVATRQEDFLRAAALAAGGAKVAIRALPWWQIRLASWVEPQLRELLELRYLFDGAVILDDPRRRQLLPDFAPTPLEAAIAATLDSYRAAAVAG